MTEDDIDLANAHKAFVIILILIMMGVLLALSEFHDGDS